TTPWTCPAWRRYSASNAPLSPAAAARASAWSTSAGAAVASCAGGVQSVTVTASIPLGCRLQRGGLRPVPGRRLVPAGQTPADGAGEHRRDGAQRGEGTDGR